MFSSYSLWALSSSTAFAKAVTLSWFAPTLASIFVFDRANSINHMQDKKNSGTTTPSSKCMPLWPTWAWIGCAEGSAKEIYSQILPDVFIKPVICNWFCWSKCCIQFDSLRSSIRLLTSFPTRTSQICSTRRWDFGIENRHWQKNKAFPTVAPASKLYAFVSWCVIDCKNLMTDTFVTWQVIWLSHLLH